MKYNICKRVSRLSVLTAVCLFSLLRVSGQNNLPDNMVETECTTDVEPMTWGVVNDWSSETIVSNLNIPLVGDLDGDGHPEILCFSLQNQSYYPSQGNVDNKMLVFDGVTKQLKTSITMDSPVSAHDAAAYGMVRTSQGKGLIVTACSDNKLRAYDITSQSPDIPGWLSDIDYGSLPSDFAVNVGFADFNGDGRPEVYVRNKIYNAENGRLLVKVSTTNTGSSYAHFSHQTLRKLSSPMAADMTGDGRPELILGNEIYEVNITNLNGVQGNVATMWRQVTPPEDVPRDGHAQVADFNRDGHLDVFISIRNTFDHTGKVCCYVWDVYNGTVSTPLNISNSHSGKSIPLLADINNDGSMEIVIQSGVSNMEGEIQAYTYHEETGTFSKIWTMNPDEDSYSNGVTAFDFNQDGLLELLICDQSTMRIVNGSGKSHLTGHDTLPVYVLASLPFTEVTVMQYPVIADVDADGAAEIVSVGSDRLNIFKSSGQPWAPTRPVWNQYLYNVTNINKDLTVPSLLFNNATAFTGPDGTVRRPFNNFLQQATKLDQYGRPFLLLPNLSVVEDPHIKFENDVLTVEMNVCNTGELPFVPPLFVSVFTASGEWMQTEEMYASLQPGECVSVPLNIPQFVLGQFENPYPLRMIFNNNGEGTAQYGGLQAECDTMDNDCHVDGRPCTITLPNVITPNGDGFNDVLLPQLEGNFSSMAMVIYDRWGRQVYRQESNESLSWDADGVSDGVYYCVVEYSCLTSAKKQHWLNTSVTVVR